MISSIEVSLIVIAITDSPIPQNFITIARMENHRHLTDEGLVDVLQRIANNDQMAFREIYHHFHKRLFYFAFAIVKTKEAAEEVVEDVFIKIWNHKENAADIRNLKIYLYTATKNTSLNYLSKKAKESITEAFDNIDINISEQGINPEQVMITEEIYKNIQKAVEQLPPRCKMIFKLIREDGLKYKEVSEILNISVNTIDAQMAIAVKRIGEAVKKHFEKFPSISKFSK